MRSPQKPLDLKEKKTGQDKDQSRKMQLFNTIVSLDYIGALEDVYSVDQWVDNYYAFR